MADESPHGKASSGRALDRFLVQADTLTDIRNRNRSRRVGSNKPTADEIAQESAAMDRYAVIRDALSGLLRR